MSLLSVQAFCFIHIKMLLELIIKHLLKSSPLVCSKFYLAVSYIGPLVFIFSWLIVRLGPLGNGTPLTCKPKPDDSLSIEALNGLAFSALHWEYSPEFQEDNTKFFEVDDKINFGFLRYVLPKLTMYVLIAIRCLRQLLRRTDNFVVSSFLMQVSFTISSIV